MKTCTSDVSMAHSAEIKNFTTAVFRNERERVKSLWPERADPRNLSLSFLSKGLPFRKKFIDDNVYPE